MGWAERGADSCRVDGGHEVWGVREEAWKALATGRETGRHHPPIALLRLLWSFSLSPCLWWATSLVHQTGPGVN